MAKPDLGNKRQCQNCGTKFFDLNKDPILCPKCGTAFQVTALSSRAASRAAPANSDDDEADTDNGAEVVPLDEADNVDDGKVTAAVPDEDGVDDDDDTVGNDDDTFLEEEEEDDGDVSDLIDGDIEHDEER